MYVVSQLHPRALAASAAQLAWQWLLVAVALGAFSIALQSFRWWYLLRSGGVGYPSVLQASFLGSLANQLLPLRPGEIIRGVVVSRRNGAPLAEVLSTQLVERITDGVAMAALIVLALHDLRLPRIVDVAQMAFAAGVGALVLLTGLLAWRERQLHARLEAWEPSEGWKPKVRTVLLAGSTGLQALRDWRRVAVSFTVALAMMTIQVAILWLALRSYHVPLGPGQAATLLAIISAGTLVPSTPGNVGSWQFFSVLGLGAMGVDSTLAAGFSVVAFAALSLGAIVGGLVALAASPFSFAELRRGRFAPERPASLVEPEG